MAKIINISEVLNKASGEDQGLLSKILSEILDVPDCGESDCPIHGASEDSEDSDRPSDSFTNEQIDNLTAADFRRFAIRTGAMAQNFILQRNIEVATALQTQSAVWVDLYKTFPDLVPDTAPGDVPDDRHPE